MGPKGERGEPGYVQGYSQSQSYSHGNSRHGSDSQTVRDIDIRRLTERMDYSNVAMKVTDYIKSESNYSLVDML